MHIERERNAWGETFVVVTTVDGKQYRAKLEDIILNSLLVLAGIWLGVLVGGLLYILATTLPRSAQLALLAVVAMAVSGGTWWAFKEGGGE